MSGWSDIQQVSAGVGHTVGLKSDGTVVATGYNSNGQCDVVGWSDIKQASADYHHSIGLKSDGTAVAAGLEVALVNWDLDWYSWDYDADQDGSISKEEALAAVSDFFAGHITKQQALEVIVLFFS